MSAQSVRIIEGPKQGQPHAEQARTHRKLQIAWRIPADALDPERRAGFESVREVLLIIRINGRATATIEDESGAQAPLRLTEVPRPGIVRSADPTRRLEHIEIEGLLSATIRRTGSRAALLYARSPLLHDLGVAGGRYDEPTLLPI